MLPQAGRVAYRQEMSRGDVDNVVEQSLFLGLGRKQRVKSKYYETSTLTDFK